MTRHEKILDRIKKLLSLANSSNEHEAALAAAAAAKLMLEHGIEQAQLDELEDREGIGQIELESGGKIDKWKGVLLRGLADTLDCVGYGSRRDGKTIYNVVGQPSKTSTLVYMYHYLVNEIKRLADSAYGEEARECEASGIERPSARSWKNAFRIGAADVIAQRLREQRAASHRDARAQGKTQALVRIQSDFAAVEAFVARHVGGLRATSSARVTSRSGIEAGRAAGHGVSLGGGKGLSAGARRLKS